jgi:hypothetical protein
MPPDTVSDVSSLLDATIRVPQHVVYRSFPSETVVLNLTMGKYHGLNATAGRMLDVLQKLPSVRDAAAALAETYDQPRSVVERDMCKLCQLLLDRGLVEIDARPRS